MKNSTTFLSLKYIPYTCTTLDNLQQEFLSKTSLSRRDLLFLQKFVDSIKKEITNPFRTALEQACSKIQELEDVSSK